MKYARNLKFVKSEFWLLVDQGGVGSYARNSQLYKPASQARDEAGCDILSPPLYHRDRLY